MKEYEIDRIIDKVIKINRKEQEKSDKDFKDLIKKEDLELMLKMLKRDYTSKGNTADIKNLTNMIWNSFLSSTFQPNHLI